MTMKTSVLVVLQLVLLTDPCLCQSALNVTQLHNHLLTQNPNVRPVKDLSQPTNIFIAFHLMSIVNFDTVQQKLISNGWMSVSWFNEYCTWMPADYGGVYTINPPAGQMWRPRVTILNTLKDLKAIGEDYIVLNLVYDGGVVWFPAERFETFCHVDVTFFPFDIQQCRWELFSWAEGAEQVLLKPVHDYIDLDSFQQNGEWKLIDTKAWSEIKYFDSSAFSILTYEVTLRRRPTLLALTVLLPVFVLSVVNVFVFTIPSEAGERLAYSMTALLSFGVFMSFILDSMPSSSESLSIVAVSLSCLLVLSAVYVLLCIASLKLFHRDPHKHPVPPSLQTLIVWLELLTCLEPPSHHQTDYHNHHTQLQVDLLSSDAQGNGVEMNGRLASHINNHHLNHLQVNGIASTISNGGVYGGITEVKYSRLKGQLDRLARRRKVKREAYTQPQDMTWRRVSRTLDKLLFRFFFCLVMVANVVIFTVTIYHYYTYS